MVKTNKMYLNVPVFSQLKEAGPRGGGGGVLWISIDGMIEGFFGV